MNELEQALRHPDVLRNLAKNKQLKKAEAYSENNPPPYPVTSVNGQIGDVTVSGISALDVYPVGSIYMSVNSVSPATLFGGTWEQLEDRFLLAAGSEYAAGTTGGAATHHHSTANHTLTVNEIPAHNHTVTVKGGYGGVKSDGTTIQKGYEAKFGTLRSDSATTANKGGNAAHSHGNTGTASSLPPYLAVYMWKRTA